MKLSRFNSERAEGMTSVEKNKFSELCTSTKGDFRYGDR